MSARYDAIIIGAGANGLVAAATLARAGKSVLVLERGDSVGGLSHTIEFAPGYRAPLHVDAGWVPGTVSHHLGAPLPGAVHPTVSVSVVHDGGVAALACDPAAAAATIRHFSSRDAERWPAFAARLGKLAGFLGTLYQIPAPDVDTTSLSDLAALVGVGRKFRALGRADMTELLRVLPMPVQDLLDDALESDVVKAAVGAGGVRDLQQGPRSGGTTFNLLHYLVGAPAGSVRARSWWRDGPQAFVVAAEAAAKGAGVTIRTGARVAQILVRDDVVAGAVLDNGEAYATNLVVSTADPSATLRGMVDPVWLDPEVLLALRNIKYRGSTAILFYALDALPSMDGLGPAELSSIVSLSPHLDVIERAYDASKYDEVSRAPHIEISAPTTRWPSLAPAGRHVIVAHARYIPRRLNDGDWTADDRAELGDFITTAIEESIPGFTTRVTHRSVLTPQDLETRFGLTDGALTHGELTLDQILFMRPIPGWGRHATPVRGLFLGGRGAHPGPGVVGGAGYLAGKAAGSARKGG